MKYNGKRYDYFALIITTRYMPFQQLKLHQLEKSGFLDAGSIYTFRQWKVMRPGEGNGMAAIQLNTLGCLWKTEAPALAFAMAGLWA